MCVQSNFENYFTFVFQGTNILFLLLAIRYQHRFNVKYRITIPMVIQLVVFALTTILTKVDIVGDSFFGVTIVTILFAGGELPCLNWGRKKYNSDTKQNTVFLLLLLRLLLLWLLWLLLLSLLYWASQRQRRFCRVVSLVWQACCRRATRRRSWAGRFGCRV